MGDIAKITLCAVAGLALMSSEASAQKATNNFREGAPGEYHIYRAPRFEPQQQPTQQRQAAPQGPSQSAPYNNDYGTRRR